jgi:hypothetical protein
MPRRTPQCQCGIYAYHTPGPRSWFGEAYWCEGIVSAWGRIVVAGDGLRAEHARVEALTVPEGFSRAQVVAAAAALGVPVVEDLVGHAGLLGGGVPQSLRP